MRIGLILDYKDVFPKESIPQYADVLKDVPSKLALEYFCFMSSRLHMNPMAQSNQKIILKELISELSSPLINKFKIAADRHIFLYKEFYMFDTYSILKVINYLLLNNNNIEKPISKVSAKDKEAIFLAVLIANNSINTEYKANLNNIENSLERFCRIIWPNITVSSDHRMRNDFEMLSYKAITFIEYILGKEEILKYFLQYFNLSSPEEAKKIVTDILSFYIVTGINKEDSYFHYAFNYDIEKENPIIAKYILNIDKYNISNFKSQDFKTLREFPILKIRENRYVIVNWNFLLQKLNTGLLFDLFYNTDLKNQYVDKLGKTHFDTFKSQIGFYYSEKNFQKIFSESVVKQNDFYFSGNPEVETESDSYLRRGNRIAIIEYKDPLMVKNLEYEKIIDEVNRKLNVAGKGTHQLVNLLDKLKDNINTFEPYLSKKINTKKIVIYPIITISEALFTSPGFSQYLNREFKKLISSKGYPFYVKPLIAIDSDFFFQTYDQFRLGNIDFFNCLEMHYSSALKNKARAKKTANIQVMIKQYNGFRENVLKVIPKNSFVKGKAGTLAQYALDKLNLPKQ